MTLTNGLIERMKTATHILVTMEIERAPERIEDQEAYRRNRLPAVYREHEAEWREAWQANPRITVTQFVAMVVGYRMAAQQAGRSAMERNMDRVRALRDVPIDPEINEAGFARARAVLRGRRVRP